ncbi:STAS domain-containing protein [Williamsia sp. MIQD14]|uniref:STAS domain-containing protein n=1 Tax=Williamsia sp. MIQD14 TaxID=3425703 RepID=UPI003DA07065
MTEIADPPSPIRDQPLPLVEHYDGNIDLTDSVELSVSLDRIVNHGGTVVLDMTTVEFLSTSALSLLSRFGRSRRRSGLVTRVAAGPRLRRSLEISGVTDWISAADHSV